MSGTISTILPLHAPGNGPDVERSKGAPRWGDKASAQRWTAPQRRAIEARRAFCRAVHANALDGFAEGSALLAGAANALALGLSLLAACSVALDELAARLLGCIAHVQCTAPGVIATHAELAAAAGGASVSTVRRRMRDLHSSGVVELVAHVFACNACGDTRGTCKHAYPSTLRLELGLVHASTSTRGAAYRVPEYVLGRIARDLLKSDQLYLSKFEQPARSGAFLKNALLPGELAAAAAIAPEADPGEAVSAAPTRSDHVVPDVTLDVPLPDRPAETCCAAGKAPDGAAAERSAALAAALRELASSDPDIAAIAAARAQSASRRALATAAPGWSTWCSAWAAIAWRVLDDATRPSRRGGGL